MRNTQQVRVGVLHRARRDQGAVYAEWIEIGGKVKCFRAVDREDILIPDTFWAVYADENRLPVFSGRTGELLYGAQYLPAVNDDDEPGDEADRAPAQPVAVADTSTAMVAQQRPSVPDLGYYMSGGRA